MFSDGTVLKLLPVIVTLVPGEPDDGVKVETTGTWPYRLPARAPSTNMVRTKKRPTIDGAANRVMRISYP